jgi:hypothetical protein
MSLHNSLEHFEGRSDIRFFREAQRLLRPGGKLLVVPLFIGDTYSTVKDAGWVDDDGVKHLWGEGARFARWYDLPHFKSRILDRSRHFAVQIHHMDNATEVHPHCFPYFALARGQPDHHPVVNQVNLSPAWGTLEASALPRP